MKKDMPKKKDRKKLRVNRWIRRNCCPACGIIVDQEYLRRYGQCYSCIMHEVGMGWSDFI